jgi:hypothetical protein
MVGALDKATEVDGVSAYKVARQQYAGDAEVLDALRTGMNDFKKLDPEQVVSMMKGFSTAEKEAFKTGAVRSIYATVMDPSSNINAAQRLIGSPEMKDRLMPLFQSKQSLICLKRHWSAKANFSNNPIEFCPALHQLEG